MLEIYKLIINLVSYLNKFDDTIYKETNCDQHYFHFNPMIINWSRWNKYINLNLQGNKNFML